MSDPNVKAFFDEATNTVSYVVADETTGEAAVIDPVLDFDLASGHLSTESADAVLEYVCESGLDLTQILETHVHADHLSAAAYLKEKTGALIGIGKDVCEVQLAFKCIFALHDMATDGSQFDRLYADNEQFHIGEISARVIATPGHTPACVCYLIGDCAFVGDTLFMPDFGTARTDFPGGDAARLYASIQKLFELPDTTRLFMCHDYKAPGRNAFAWETTVALQRERNIHVHSGIGQEDYVSMREERDSQLGMPKLIIPSLQVNLCAGQLPRAADNGIQYLKFPLNAL